MEDLDLKPLRAACKLAVRVAVAGELADPRVPSPPEMRPILGFSRLSAAAYSAIARVVDDDGIFRARVAAEASEADVGRAGWLWLTRPVDWFEDPVFEEGRRGGSPAGTSPARDKKGKKKGGGEALAKARRAAETADKARKRAEDEVSELQREVAELTGTNADVEAARTAATEERNAAVRRAQALETEAADLRGRLRAAREATRQAEAELLAVRSRPEPVSTTSPSGSERTPVRAEAELDRQAVSASVRAAASAAADLAEALSRTASAVAGPAPGGDSARGGGEPAPEPAVASGGGRDRARSRSRAQPSLPGGVFGDTIEAHRCLLASSANLLVVDGYNLARQAWSGIDPEEERRRVVALLEDIHARSGISVLVVFDGDDHVHGPSASRVVRVRYSASGQTADEAIADFVAEMDPAQPIVVVSSDREVVADARRLGAVPMASADLLRAARR